MPHSVLPMSSGRNYFRGIAYPPIFCMNPVRFLILLITLLASPALLLSQNCSDALNNDLCADTPQPADSLTNTPFNNACINVDQSAFYSFTTNSIADQGSVNVAVSWIDCEFTNTGTNDSIYIMVIPLLPGEDPCNPPANASTICYGDSSDFDIDINNLATNQEYLVVVGSNHDDTFGPCSYSVNISGSAVDLMASVDPILVSLGESAGLVVEGADPTQTITWTPSQFLDNANSANPTVLAEETTAFQVTGFVGDCELSDVVSLTIGPPVEIFNTFTPNDDAINDFWRIKYIERFPNCQVEVFDRWGQSVFKSVGYAQPWDGTFKGRYLPTGPYYFVLELNSLEVTIPPITGTVSIVH